MRIEFFWSASERALFGPSGRFDAWTLSWQSAELPSGTESVGPIAALERLASNGGMRRAPVGVVGPKLATEDELRTAEYVGGRLAQMGLQLLCGGKNGVMEAVCKGCAEAGGMPIGLLPDNEWSAANRYVAIPIPTGIGPARNALIARGCQVLIAIGGGHGTLSEMALALHFDRPVLSLGNAPSVEGAIICATADEALERMAIYLLRPQSERVS
ncbi:TIGR00725 family protein [Devosia sp.]|uniref:TIGR00725 family protein n=1 Tax=Devosia sp. TaxID=1871048 RepID=UPI0025C4FBDA|nr:TIGR00725 family protein [Devosia sp.]